MPFCCLSCDFRYQDLSLFFLKKAERGLGTKLDTCTSLKCDEHVYLVTVD